MLKSVITHNLEVSFNLTAKDIKLLNDLDMQLLRGSLRLGAKSSQCLVHLELGLCSVSFILKRKGLLYLFQLLTTDQSTLVAQVFSEQVRTTRKGDWVDTVMKDLNDLEINLSFSQIASMGKNVFKQLVKESCDTACFKQLLVEKLKLSKGKDISYSLLETQPYLMSESGVSIENMRRIYHVRCREIPLKTNFLSAFEDDSCLFPLCTDKDSQNHIFASNCFSSNNQIIQTNVRYSDIFGFDVELQVNNVNILFSRLEKRKQFITLSGRGFPMDPRSKQQLPRLGIQKAKINNKIKKRMNIHNKS